MPSWEIQPLPANAAPDISFVKLKLTADEVQKIAAGSQDVLLLVDVPISQPRIRLVICKA